MKQNIVIALIAVIAFCVSSEQVFAEAMRRDDDQGAMAKAQYMLQQMAGERDSLKAANAKLQDQVNGLKKKTTGLNKEAERLKKRLTASGGEINHYKEKYKALTDRLLDTRQKFQEVIDKFKQTIATLRQVEGERNQLKVTLQDRTRETESCIKKNIDLYQTNLDLVKQYKNKGVIDALFQKDPVTGLKEVEIENTVQNYKTRLEQLRATAPVHQSAAD